MRGGGHKDLAATEAAGFTDPRSYVRTDGKRFLFGYDIEQLRRQVFGRDGYHCTGEVEGERCNRPVSWSTAHLHHVIPRGKRGDDSASNLVTLCRFCHARLHSQVRLKWVRVANAS
jgi:hypothetical protein